MKSVMEKICVIQELYKKQTSEMEIRMTALEGKIKKLETKEIVPDDKTTSTAVESVKRELEKMKIEARSSNLIFHGVKEQLGETRISLKEEISRILNQHYGKPDAPFDLPSRLGIPTLKSRPVKVTFTHKSDRDSILYRRYPGSPYSVKADVPPETAARRGILGRLTRWAKEKKMKHKRTDNFVEIEGVRYDPEEAKDFLDAHDDNRQYPTQDDNNAYSRTESRASRHNFTTKNESKNTMINFAHNFDQKNSKKLQRSQMYRK